MTSRLSTLILVIVGICFSSCNRMECRNTNVIFDNFSPDSEEYKSELAKQIKNAGAANLSYWHDKYLKKQAGEYLVVYIQGQNLCAKGEIQVTDWSKITEMRKENSGYSRAKLEGLNFEIIHDSKGINFLYKNIHRILDYSEDLISFCSKNKYLTNLQFLTQDLQFITPNKELP